MTLRDQLGKPVLFHWVGWHSKDGKPSPTGYDSRSPNVISSQLDAMQSLGGDGFGVIALTYGPTVSPFIHQAVTAMGNQCNARGVPFALCMDPWTVKNSPDKNTAMIAALQHPETQFLLNMRCYLPGKPVLDFATGCDPKVVLASVPNIQYWLNGPDFAWPRIPGPTNNAVKLPCVCLEFDDGTGPDRNKQVWDQTKPVRLLPARAGNLFWDMVVPAPASTSDLPSQPIQYVQFVTWNDVAEKTDVEKVAAMLLRRIG